MPNLLKLKPTSDISNLKITPSMMASSLNMQSIGWTSQAIASLEAQHGIVSNLPIQCSGSDECPYGSFCKVQNPPIGEVCPTEAVIAFRLFAGYIIDLRITPEDYSDVQLVVDLVRLLMYMRKCDLYAKDKPIWETRVISIDKATGRPITVKDPVLAFDMQQKIRGDIKDLYEQLIASRSAKARRDATLRDGESVGDILIAVRRAASSMEVARLPSATDELEDDLESYEGS